MKIARESGKNYFDGEVCDGSRKLWFIVFESPQQKLLNRLMQHSTGKKSSKVEVKLKGTTKIVESPNKFEVAPTEYKSLAPAMEITV